MDLLNKVDSVSSKMSLLLWLTIAVCALVALLPVWIRGNLQADMLNQARLQISVLYCVLCICLLLTKDWRMIVSMGAVLLFNLYWMSSAYPTLAPGPSSATASHSFRLYSQNIYEANRNVSGVVRSIQQVDPDVVVLMEVTTPVYDYLVGELRETLPYHDLQNKHYMKPGLALFSKYKLESRMQTLPEDPRLPSIKSRIMLQDKPIDIIGVHLESPHDAHRIRSRNKQIGKLTKLIKYQQQSGVPLLLAGDMNTTPWNTLFRKFQRETNLSHADSFWSLNNSWPAWLPAALGFAIDHVLINDQFCNAKRFRLPDVGSDHFAFVSELELCN
ncbi:MAG: endonuclease/exonuclease/phosphatase family protein [Ketobacter sp.]